MSGVVVLVAAVTVVFVFLLQRKPEAEGWGPVSISVAGLFVIVLAGLVLFAFGGSGPELTSAETDKVIAERFERLRRKLLPVVFGIVLSAFLYAGYLVWRLYASA